MTPPNYEQVIQDCDSALALDKNYVKALNRRASALEKLNRNEEALRGSSPMISYHSLYMIFLRRLHGCDYPEPLQG
jgi:hypothetical protein